MDSFLCAEGRERSQAGSALRCHISAAHTCFPLSHIWHDSLWSDVTHQLWCWNAKFFFYYSFTIAFSTVFVLSSPVVNRNRLPNLYVGSEFEDHIVLWEFTHCQKWLLFFFGCTPMNTISQLCQCILHSVHHTCREWNARQRTFVLMDRSWGQVEAGMGLLGEQRRCLQSSIYSQRTHKFLHQWFPGRRLLVPRFFDGLFSLRLKRECAHFNLGVSAGRLKLLSKMSHPSSRTDSAT